MQRLYQSTCHMVSNHHSFRSPRQPSVGLTIKSADHRTEPVPIRRIIRERMAHVISLDHPVVLLSFQAQTPPGLLLRQPRLRRQPLGPPLRSGQPSRFRSIAEPCLTPWCLAQRRLELPRSPSKLLEKPARFRAAGSLVGGSRRSSSRSMWFGQGWPRWFESALCRSPHIAAAWVLSCSFLRRRTRTALS